jgi:hypothetical protein
LQAAAIDLFDECLELAGAGVHRQQSARTVAHQQPPVASDGQTQRSAAGVADDGGLTLRSDPHDAPVVDTGPDVPVGVDHHVLWRVSGHRDDGEVGRREVGQRVDRRWLPADRIDGWFRSGGHAASLAVSRLES